MLASEVGKSNIQANVIKEDFKMLVVRRKLSTIPNDPEEYDFDSDFNSNCATAECYIDSTGDTGVGLFLVNGETKNPPTWADFVTYAQTVPVISDQVSSSTSGEYAIAKGNTNQNAGQTNWYFDCREDASNWLPQYNNSGIEPINDNYVYAYDCWLTPFKFYRFGLWVDGGAICFKWYGNSNLVTPSYTDGGLLSEPVLSSRTNLTQLISFEVNYYSGIVSSNSTFLQPQLYNIYFLPCKMDDKIALNINWFYGNNDTNDALCYPMACSNSYRDDTMIEGGKEENDINYDGILSKYYGQEGDLVSGDIPEIVFETIKVLIRERTYLQSTHCKYSDTPSLEIKSAFFDLQNVVSDNWVSDFKGTIKAPFSSFNNAFNEHSIEMPLGQMNMPDSEFPTNYISSTYSTVYNPQKENQDVGSYLKIGPTSSSNSRVVGFGRAFTGPTAVQHGYQLDTEYSTRYYANCDAYSQMFELQFKDDGLVHLYDIFFEEPNNTTRPTNCISFAITYNSNFLTERTSGFSQVRHYTPYKIKRRQYYGGSGIELEAYLLSYGRAFVERYSNDRGYYDSVWQLAESLPNMNVEDGTSYTGDGSICRGLNDTNGQDPPLCYLYVMETPYSNNGNDEYRRELAFYYPPNDFYSYGHTGTGGHLTQKTITLNLKPYENQVIDNPINKNDNGKISTPNDDENQGEGSNSKNPDDKGTHDNTVIDTPKVPPKTTNVLASGLLSMYVIDNDNLRKLGGDLFSDNIFQQIQVGVSKPLDCVLRIAESRIAPPKESNDRPIKLGSANISARGIRVTKDIKVVDCGSTYLARRNGDYTDCQEKCQIYLPFIGYRDLDGNYLQNKRVYLVYKFNFLNGKCIANIYVSNPNGKANEKGKALYQTYNGDFITTFPLGTMSNTGMLSMLMSAGLGAISHNMYYARASIRSLPNALVPQAEHTGEFGANNATLINELTPCIHRWKLSHTWSEKSGDITGEISYKRIKLSNAQNGYIKCKNFELSSIPTSITKDECEKIKELLNNGVWKA